MMGLSRRSCSRTGGLGTQSAESFGVMMTDHCGDHAASAIVATISLFTR